MIPFDEFVDDGGMDYLIDGLDTTLITYVATAYHQGAASNVFGLAQHFLNPLFGGAFTTSLKRFENMADAILALGGSTGLPEHLQNKNKAQLIKEIAGMNPAEQNALGQGLKMTMDSNPEAKNKIVHQSNISIITCCD